MVFQQPAREPISGRWHISRGWPLLQPEGGTSLRRSARAGRERHTQSSSELFLKFQKRTTSFPGPRGLNTAMARVRRPASVTGLGAGIGECHTRYGNELPVETRLVQSQLEHTEGIAVANQAVRRNGTVEG